jgi:hypothetical protein
VVDVELLPPPQADKLPSTIMNTKMPTIDRQFRRQAGILRNTRNANIAPLPAPIHSLPLRKGWSIAVLPVVVIVNVAVPLAVPAVIATVEPAVQVGA